MDERADTVRGLVHVDTRREGVLTDGVELVAVPDGDVSERLEVLLLYCFDYLFSPEY